MARRAILCSFLLLAVDTRMSGAAAVCEVGTATPVAPGVLNFARLDAGCKQYFTIKSNAACQPDSYLMLEVWDVERAYLNSSQQAPSMAPANPLLVAAQSQQPDATYLPNKGTFTLTPVTSYADVQGFRLGSPYSHVQVPFGNMCPDGICWFITLKNVELSLTDRLTYIFRFTCAATAACQSPVLLGSPPDLISPSLGVGTMAPAPQCAGQGTCASQDTSCGVAETCATCSCDAGWGGVGCEESVAAVANTQLVSNAGLVSGAWAYYDVELAADASALLVEMNRTRGDPVLFVKPVQLGFQPGGVPEVPDFDANFADSNSFRNRLDDHYLLLKDVQAGSVYVGVYNNDMYLKEDAVYQLRATWVNKTAGGPPLCARDCSGNGLCVQTGLCKCFDGYGGPKCEGKMEDLLFRQTKTGQLLPGQWQYYKLNLAPSDDSWQNGVLVNFNNVAGNALLVARAGSEPTFTSSTFTFRSKPHEQGPQSFKVQPSDLSSGIYYFGVFDVDYYQHDAFSFTLSVVPIGRSRFSLSPYMSIILGVTASLFLCLCVSICKRLYNRHGLPWRPRPPGQVVPTAVPAAPRGVDPTLVQSFPTFEYKRGALASPDAEADPEAGMAQPALSGPGRVSDDSQPQCSVCLCEYESGEMLRRLPPCGHEFHLKCIDLWLTQHTTCPMCRSSLLADGGTSEAGTPMSPLQGTDSNAMLITPVDDVPDSAGDSETQPQTPHADHADVQQQHELTPRGIGEVNSEARSLRQPGNTGAAAPCWPEADVEMTRRQSRS